MTRKVLSIKTPAKQATTSNDAIVKLCLNCRFFSQHLEEYPDSGECRRRPPFFNQAKEFSAWPMVNEYDWCGEFKRISTPDA
jgi:hypothetical protein